MLKIRSNRRTTRFWGAVRVIAFLSFVSFTMTAFTLRSVYGDVKESAFRLGRDMLKLGDVLGPPQPVLLNGATIYAGGRHVNVGVKEFLDRFEKDCEERSAGFEDDLRMVPPDRLRALPDEWRHPERLGVMRLEADDKEGMLSCLVRPDDARGVRALLARMQAFIETGDASRMGHVHFVFARKNERLGGSDVVTVWNDGPLQIDQIFEAEHDVPGRDTEGAPRPPGTRRVLSAEVQGVPYGYRVYESEQSSANVLAFYDKAMSDWGWEPFAAPPDDEGTLDHQRAFLKGNAALFIDAESDGDKTTLQVVEMGSRGAVQVEVKEPR